METRWVAVGGPAFDALCEVVASVKAGDPLAPVTVVTPTPAAAVSLRRALARRSGGIAVVGFQSLDALATQIAAPRLGADGIALGIDREVLVAAIRVELARQPGRFGPIAHHRSTWETLARTVAEIAALDPEARATVASAGELPAEVVRLHDLLADTVGFGGRVAVLREATDRIRAEPDVLAPHGPVVVHLPGNLDTGATDLLRAIGEQTSVVVIGAQSGDVVVDHPVIDGVVRIGGAPPHDDGPPPAAPSSVISTNDIDDEIRAAVRALLARAEDGHPLHTMALVHPASAPYTRAVAEVLRTTGIPFSGPSTETLGHTVPGRVVLGLLDVAAHRFSRQSVVDLWASGIVLGADGRAVRTVRLDERTRKLGIIGGRSDWHTRVDGRRRWLTEHPPEPTDSAEVTEHRIERHVRELGELDEIDGALDAVEVLLDGMPASWDALAQWVGDVFDTLCGPMTRRSEWPAHELEADTAIRTVIGRLSALADVEPHPGPAVLTDTLRSALDAPAPRRSSTGTGLLVTTLEHPPVVPLTAVAVLGMAEGHVPRLGRDDVLLADAVRRSAGLPLSDDATLDQHRALLAALATASDLRLLTYARCDQRSGRTQVPSRWLVDAIERMTGIRPRTEALITGTHIPGVDVVKSHSAAVRGAAGPDGVPLHGDEHRLATLAATDDFDAHPAALDPVVAAGALLRRSRAADAFTRFDGNLGGDGVDVLAEGQRHLSPTSIETYASCPRKWFFRQALGIHDVDRPEEVERLQPHDKGSLAHRILERFVGDAIEAGTVPAPDEAWGPDGDVRLVDIAADEFAEFERLGLTGHRRWWAYDRREIIEVLLQTLRRDDQLRAATRSRPVAVELTFGRDGEPPLQVTLDDGRVVPLAGQADRVDAVPGGVRVYDYKYASSGPYKGLDKEIADGGDPLEGGRRLQLLAYAEAAAAQRHGVDRSSAWYWFLKPGHTGHHIGYEIGPEHRRLFRETLGVLVDAVGQGLYPARSGPHDWFLGTNTNCGYCDFKDICPADREEEWERVRADPALADVVRLAEEGAPAFLVTATATAAGTQEPT